jgi:hypothetical protein
LVGAMPSQEVLVLAYVAAALKFSAVPAAAFELLTKERRAAIETWLVGKLPRLIRSFSITLVVLYVCVALLVKAGPYLVVVYIFFGNLISPVVLSRLNEIRHIAAFYSAIIVLSIAILIAAILEKWVIPETWIVAIGYPFETVSNWANAHPYVDWFLPDYSAQKFLEDFRHVFRAIEDWLWSWLAFLNAFYFFFARGAMLLTVVVIQLLLLLGASFGVLIVLGFPVYAFIKLSDYFKRRMRIDKDRIPLLALIFWAFGETIEFAMKTQEFFWR